MESVLLKIKVHKHLSAHRERPKSTSIQNRNYFKKTMKRKTKIWIRRGVILTRFAFCLEGILGEYWLMNEVDPKSRTIFLWVNVYFCLSFSSLIMLPFWQHSFPNKSLQVFFLLEIDVVSQNCKTQNTLSVQLVILEQFQIPPGRSFRISQISIMVLWRCYQWFYEDVIHATPFTVHTDLNTMIF